MIAFARHAAAHLARLARQARFARRPAGTGPAPAAPVFHPPGVVRLLSPAELTALAGRADDVPPAAPRAQEEAWAR